MTFLFIHDGNGSSSPFAMKHSPESEISLSIGPSYRSGQKITPCHNSQNNVNCNNILKLAANFD